MTSNVYHVHFLDHQLPESEEEKARFAREYGEQLTGERQGDVTILIQPSERDPSCRVTITVPTRLGAAVRRVEESGLRPVFTEPEAPYVDGNSCVIPSTFQIVHFGRLLEPRMVEEHPERQTIIVEALAAHVPDFPEQARNILEWEYLETDPETGTAVLYWQEYWRGTT